MSTKWVTTLTGWSMSCMVNSECGLSQPNTMPPCQSPVQSMQQPLSPDVLGNPHPNSNKLYNNRLLNMPMSCVVNSECGLPQPSNMPPHQSPVQSKRQSSPQVY
ncbi:hypothetical protein TNIN_52321 [Trichonephila inaurata madagascariensis]|uniref:Uncharacterized protein n=1 Tax=Trichonephila inaurata madagascariensis TaxID=2747483 RepID=A0A8X6JK15_9ARAC|nr:hypothetical protein TNIN_52321 [Trichonephila inaurata madagascariensis]